MAAVVLAASAAGLAAPAGAQEPCDALIEAALEAVRQNEFGSAERLLLDARLRCPEDPDVLMNLGALRFRQGRYDEAGRMGHALLELEPGSRWAWDLIGVTRYVRSDRLGALDAWNRIDRLRVPSVRVRDADSGAVISWAEGVTGIVPGDLLTRGAFLLGARRLAQVPAFERTRLEYRPQSTMPGGQVEGTVTLRPRHSMTRSALPEHLLRALGGRIVLEGRPGGSGAVTDGGAEHRTGTSAWSAGGVVDGSLREGSVALAHRAPGLEGVWRWELHHATGRFEAAGAAPLRVRRTGARWSHGAWVLPLLKVEGALGADRWQGRGSYGAAGVAVDLVPGRLPARLRWEADGWLGDDRFGRAAFRAEAEFVPLTSTEVGLRGGMDAISRGAPPDIVPRFGAGRAVTHPMRAAELVGSNGTIRPAFPGSTWVHAGVELIRWHAPGGPLRVGGAAFVDAVRVLDPPPGSTRGAAHPGLGIRLGTSGSSGYLRADVAIDPAGGDPVFSAAWVGR